MKSNERPDMNISYRIADRILQVVILIIIFAQKINSECVDDFIGFIREYNKKVDNPSDYGEWLENLTDKERKKYVVFDIFEDSKH